MVADKNQNRTLDPVEMLNAVLEQIWHALCCSYDATGDLPDIKVLFEGADLSKSFQAAKVVVANMLLEMTENIGRFSPWYTRPARSFGLVSMRDPVADSNRWMLAPEAVQKWGSALDRLSVAIEENYSLIQAMVFVEGLMEDAAVGDVWVVARCHCQPPRTIQVTRAVLEKAEILCDACMQPFAK